MKYNFDKEVKMFMIFDILGDTVRSGPLLWKIDRKRLEDVKNHVMDLIFMARILRKYLPSYLNYDLIYDYIICHDIPEVITGDITKFEGISEEEIKRVTNLAIKFLSDNYDDVMDFDRLLNGYENIINIESKIVYMLDKIDSFSTFLKYQSEKNIDMKIPLSLSKLNLASSIIKMMDEGKDLGDIFYEVHSASINITDEECIKYNISRDDANLIVEVIKSFADEMYSKKQSNTLLVNKKDFPKDAVLYNNDKVSFDN